MLNRRPMDELTKEELRKERKKRAQMQAYGLLVLGIIVAIGAITGIGFLISGLLHNINKNDTKTNVAHMVSENNETSKDKQEEVAETQTEEDSVEEETIAKQVEEAKENEPEPEKSVEELQKEALQKYVASFIESMTIEEKVAGLFFVTPESLTGVSKAIAAGSSTSEALSQYSVGGIVFDEKNMIDESQFRDMVYNTKSFCKYELFTGVNDEGGEESPFSKSGLRTEEVLSEKAIGETSGAAGAYSAGISMASTLSSFGLSLNFAPLGDIMLSETSFIADRTFGSSSPENTASLTKNMIKGMNDQGTNSCLKYFPGYGDAVKGPEHGRVISKRTKEDLVKNEYEIVKAAMEADVPMIMVSHVSMQEITGDIIPASLSGSIITDILRGELGYDGIIITDYMNKNAITRNYKHADAAVRAIEAGADMILAPSDFKKAYNGLLAAVEKGDITEERLDESLYRIFMVKYKNSVDYDETILSEE